MLVPYPIVDALAMRQTYSTFHASVLGWSTGGTTCTGGTGTGSSSSIYPKVNVS
eukprot:COSAG05_NODE_20513_length_278_cov_133.837989_1_plen_53_part_10